jgi:hypothetical protein
VNISSVVDIDNHAFESDVQQELAERFAESSLFKYVLLFTILINSIIIGVQTDSVLVRMCAILVHANSNVQMTHYRYSHNTPLSHSSMLFSLGYLLWRFC